MSTFIKVSIDPNILHQVEKELGLYIVRAKELIDNFEDIQNDGFSFHGGHNFYRNEGGFVTGGNLNINPHRLKGLFLDFRFFIANDEPTCFRKFTGMLGKLSEDPFFRQYLKSEKKIWKDEGILKGWVNVDACDLIVTYFNSKAFHGLLEGEEKYKTLLERMDRETLNWLLCYYIDVRVRCVSRISRMIESYEQGYFKVPENA